MRATFAPTSVLSSTNLSKSFSISRIEEGFTLVELVTTLIILGILAAVVIPRFLGTKDFDARAFSDQTLALLRYAQKAAVAQHRTVCVTFSASGASPTTIALQVTSSFAQSGPCDTDLAGPNGTAPYSIAGSSGISFSSAPPVTYPANFTFDPLGQASIFQKIQVSGASNVITIEQETGYVH